MVGPPPRDVDRLDPLPDGKICEQDQAYLERHQIGPLFNKLMHQLMRHAPADPVQYMIDSLTLSPEDAAQDPETGLPKHRQSKLEKVFRIIDKSGTGRMSMRALQAYANSHGGETLTNADLRAIFKWALAVWLGVGCGYGCADLIIMRYVGQPHALSNSTPLCHQHMQGLQAGR